MWRNFKVEEQASKLRDHEVEAGEDRSDSDGRKLDSARNTLVGARRRAVVSVRAAGIAASTGRSQSRSDGVESTSQILVDAAPATM